MFPVHQHIPLKPGKKPILSSREIRLVQENAKEDIGDWGFVWERHWHGLPMQAFDVLSPEAKVRLWQGSQTSNHFTDLLSKEEPFRLIDRVRLCYWQYGCERGWKPLAEAYNKLCTFDFGEKDFSTTIDYPWTWMGRGSGEYCRRWIDGGLAYLLHYKGKFVAILGFSVSRVGLLIQQAQAVEKHGNRWMFRLPGKLLDVMIHKLEAHFACPTWIVDGATQGAYLRKIHPQGTLFPEGEQNRIAAMYDAPIPGFRRTSQTWSDHLDSTPSRSYFRLEKNPTNY